MSTIRNNVRTARQALDRVIGGPRRDRDAGFGVRRSGPRDLLSDWMETKTQGRRRTRTRTRTAEERTVRRTRTRTTEEATGRRVRNRRSEGADENQPTRYYPGRESSRTVVIHYHHHCDGMDPEPNELPTGPCGTPHGTPEPQEHGHGPCRGEGRTSGAEGRPNGGTMVEGYNLEDVNSVKLLLRDAAGGDETAKKVLAENSQLIDLTLQSFAQQERAFSNLSQAFFDIDKALIQNIRV